MITKSHTAEEIHVSKERSRLVSSAATADPEELAHIIWQDSSLIPHVKNCFLAEISSQCASIRGDTSSFGSSLKAIEVLILVESIIN